MKNTETEKTLTCPNCGGEVPRTSPRCPYCGQFNPWGAEQEYLSKLDHIRSDTGDLAEQARGSFRSGLGHSAKRMALLALIVLALIVAALVISGGARRLAEERARQESLEKAAFEQEHFPELDRLYQAGDDQALWEYAARIWGEPGGSAIFNWRHFGYLDFYDTYRCLRNIDDALEQGEKQRELYLDGVSYGLRLTRQEPSRLFPRTGFPEEDKERAEPFCSYAEDFLQRTLGMSGAELDALARSVSDEWGMTDEEKLQDELAQFLRQTGAE